MRFLSNWANKNVTQNYHLSNNHRDNIIQIVLPINDVITLQPEWHVIKCQLRTIRWDRWESLASKTGCFWVSGSLELLNRLLIRTTQSWSRNGLILENIQHGMCLRLSFICSSSNDWHRVFVQKPWNNLTSDNVERPWMNACQ